MKRILTTLAALVLAAGTVHGQELVRQVSQMSDGTMRASYRTRPGTCGHGDNIQLATQRQGFRGTLNNEPCVEGPAFLQLEVRDGRVVEADVRVGSESWDSPGAPVTSMGRIPASEAAASLLVLAERSGESGEDLVFAAVLADSADLVEPLFRLARQSGATVDTRKAAVFWVSHGIEADVTGDLEELAMDGDPPMPVRESAVFGLSQENNDEAVAALQRVAQSDSPLDLRKNAVFWLGQTDGAGAVSFLIELAQGSGPLGENAVFALSQHDSPEARAALRALVTDSAAPSSVRENAIFWLGQGDDPANVDFLRDAYRQLDDPALKEKVIFSMSQLDTEDAADWLLTVAQDPDETTDVRKNALFWAGQSEAAKDRLIALYDNIDNRDMKKQLIFVYSQADGGASLRKLMDIARNEQDHDLRENAIFWLGQSDEPEALAFLEDLIIN